jgi:hypothetical protein
MDAETVIACLAAGFSADTVLAFPRKGSSFDETPLPVPPRPFPAKR